MISRRDVLVAAASSVLTLTIGLAVVARTQGVLMSPAVFEWEKVAVKTTKTGSTRSFFNSPTATLDQLECHVTTLNPGEAPHPAHTHPDEELIIVKEGLLESNQDGVVKRVGPGSIIFEASNQLHGLKNAGNTQVTYFVIKWVSPGKLKPKPSTEELD